MSGGSRMGSCVTVQGIVATSDVPACDAPSEVHPPQARLFALKATSAARRNGRIKYCLMVSHGRGVDEGS